VPTAAASAAASPICDTLARPSLRVKVLDAQSGQAICDAKVEAHGAGSPIELIRNRGRTPQLCAYHSMHAGPGEHRVAASKLGYTSASEAVTLVKERCFVTGPVVTLRLKRKGAAAAP
jgi:hypothetical protein